MFYLTGIQTRNIFRRCFGFFLLGNCSFREDCVLKEWSDWSGNIPNGGCAVQIRTRDYNKSLEYIERETCDGLESCPAITEDARTKCKWREVIYLVLVSIALYQLVWFTNALT